MKKTLALALICVSTFANASRLVEFTFTKPHSLLNFVETILGGQGGSRTIDNIFKQSRFNTPASRAQLDKLKNLRKDYSYRFDGYPDSRYMMRTTWELMTIASAKANTLEELKVNTVGLLPNADQHQLFEVLMYFDTIYSDLIWNDNLTKLQGYCAQLSDYAQNRNINSIFQTLSKFYGSSWDSDVPFKVCLYPIPSKNGNSTATPKGNIVTCGVLLDSYDYANNLSVVFHELCHLLYREQTPDFQNKFENWFKSSKSPSRLLAYQLADEGIATALGNGWVYEKLSGKLDSADWYNDVYINKFSKNSFPLIKEYLDNNQTVDEKLIQELCEVYYRCFPNANREFNNLFSNIQIVADLGDQDTPNVFPELFKRFRVGGAGLSTPLDAVNLADLNTHLATRIIIISADHKKTWDFIRKNLPESKEFKTPDLDKSFVKLHNASNGQNYIFLNLKSPGDLGAMLEAMKNKGVVDESGVIYN